MNIKQPGWYAAGPEMQRAVILLSDGGFRLYFYLCVNASRRTGRIRISYGELARALMRSRRSIASHFDELREKRVCVVAPAANQHSRTEVEICDDFWSYTKEGTATAPLEWENYLKRTKTLLSKRACIQCVFSAADEKFTAELFARKVSLDDVERAIALACCRKYVGLLNGTDNEMIRRFGYFRDTIDEVLDPDGHPSLGHLLDQRLQSAEYYEEKWLAKQALNVDAAPASTARSGALETNRRDKL